MSNAGSAQRLGLVSFANPALHDPAAIAEVPIDPPGWIYREILTTASMALPGRA